MNYTLNQALLGKAFVLPAEIADKHLKLATRDQLRVILYIYRNCADLPSVKNIGEALNVTVQEALDALFYWQDAGVIVCEKRENELHKKTSAKIEAEKPTREEIAAFGKNDGRLMFLFSEIQSRLARPLRQSEASTFAWMYIEEGMDVSVILMLVEYALGLDKANIRFMEKTAIAWLDAGVEDIASAEEFIAKNTREEMCHKLFCSAFGIKDRKLNKTERELAVLWVNDYGYDRKLLEAAYDVCIDTTGKYNIKYIKGIIDRWHKDGVKAVDDIKETPKKAKNGDWDSSNKELLELLINSD